MADILIAKIKTTIKTYTQNIRPFLHGVLNHVHGIEHLDKNTLTGLLEQASNHTIVFQQNFDVYYYTLLKFSPSTLDSVATITNLSKDYEWYLNFVGLTFAFALNLDIDKDDYPVLKSLMLPLKESEEKLASCYNSLQQFLLVTKPSTTGTMTTQIETEDPATQDSVPPTPSDTPRHPVAHPDTEHDFEHDPELDSEDQNILATASTDSPNMSPDSNVIETEATSEASTELPNMSPDSNVIETEATSEASTELPNMSSDSNVIEPEATSEASTELPNMSPDSNVIETEATTESTELPNMSPDSNVIETEATSEASTELPNMSSDSNVIEPEATSEASTELPNMSPDSVIETEATSKASTESPNVSPDSYVIETEAPKSDMITVDLKTQDTPLNPKSNPMPKKTRTPRYKFKRIKKGGKVQKIQSPGVHKMKSRHHRNKRIYWSKKLWYANNISHVSNPSTLHNFCPMVTSNTNGLHTVIHSQNMWLLRRPRVKIK